MQSRTKSDINFLNGLFFLIAINFLLMSFLSPLYEGPDECHHIAQILNNDIRGIYYEIVRFIYNCLIDLVGIDKINPCDGLHVNNGFHYLDNSFYYINSEFSSQLIALKFINLMLITTIAYLYLKFCKLGRDFDTNIIILAVLLWPGISARLIDVSSDFFSILLAIFSVKLYLSKKTWVIYLLCIFGVLFDDNSYVIIGVFYAVLWFLTFFDMSRLKSMLFAIVAPILAVMLLFFLLATLVPSLYEYVNYHHDLNLQYSNSFIGRIGTVFLSMYYVGGSLSFTALSLEYILFAGVVCNLFLSNNLVKSDFVYPVAALVFVFLFFTGIIQPMTHARYYFVFIPFLVLAIKINYFFNVSGKIFAFKFSCLMICVNICHLLLAQYYWLAYGNS